MPFHGLLGGFAQSKSARACLPQHPLYRGAGAIERPPSGSRKDGKLELVIVNHDQNPDIPLTGELKLLG